MTITDSLGSKVVASVVGLALALSLFGFAGSASAQTVEELQAQISNLLATITQLQSQLSSMTGGSTAGGYTYTRDLTDGSTGADVTALQNMLIGAGFSIPAGATGYFGSQTKAALAAYQSAHGISPAVGYFGPITRASVNTSAGSGTGTGTGTGTGVTTGAGTEGSLTVTLESSPSAGTDVEKGQTKNVVAIKLEADDSDLTVNRVDANFDVRPWLYLSSIALLDGSTVVKEMSGLSSADFVEVTEGSDYRLRMSGLNITVPQGTKKVLTLRVTALASTDKTAVTVTTTFKANAVRATDSRGLQHEEPAAALTGRTWDFKVNTTGNVKATLDANSPEARNVIVTNTGTTENVELMRFELEAEHSQVDVNSLRFTLATGTTTLASFGTLFDDVWLADNSGNRIASASTVASTTIFSTADLDGSGAMIIPSGSKKSYRLMATAADADDFANGTNASSSLTANTTNIVGEDSVFDTVTVTSSTVTGSDVYFYAIAAEFSGLSASVPSIVATYLANLEFKMTLTAKGGDIYVSKTPATMLATSTTATDTVSATGLTSVVASGSTSGDTSTAYKIGSGASRTFTFAGSMSNLNGTAGSQEFKVTQINWDDDTTGLQEFNTTFGLENLEVNPTLGATAI
ncbi:MAG TPA: peptidoglycan-binding domain-containing protein [Candidatus Paceibacterota bacterium]